VKSIRFLPLIVLLLLVPRGFCRTVSVEVETQNAGRASSSILRVFCITDVAISGLRIPLRIDANSDFAIDSVSFAQTVATPDFRLQSQISNSIRTGFINVMPEITDPVPSFPAPGGEICRIYFHISPTASNAMVAVDTFYRTTQEGGQTVYQQLEASDSLGMTILPQFSPGGVHISEIASAEDGAMAMPQFTLAQNYPNPFNPSTQIVFSLPRAGKVKIDVLDINGSLVATLCERRFPAGEHTVTWNAEPFPSGVYFYRLQTSQGVLIRKMLLVK
jgi:hypothetical protein